ncbi:MAG: hypothetical protein ACTS73_06510 [Arsenophonus sp. NEOnobi-MAG3]
MSGKIISFACWVIIDVTKHSHKELVAVEDAYRESEANLAELINALQIRVA